MERSLINNVLDSLETPLTVQSETLPIPIVLIVDDDDDSRLMLKTLLESWKYLVIEATDGVEAIKSAEENCPDMIIADVKLPSLDGFGVTQKLRQSPKTEKIPIAFLSGCAEAVYIRQGFAAGGNEYLTKPLDFEELKIILGRYIRPA